MNRLVYLAGPITSLSHDTAELGWRAESKKLLAAHDIQGISPLRTQDYLRGVESIGFTYNESPFGTQRGVMKQDHFDLCRSAVVFANLLGAKKISAGTVMEFGWAWDRQKMLVVVMESEGNPHDLHPMIMEAIDFRVSSLQAGIDTVRRLISTD